MYKHILIDLSDYYHRAYNIKRKEVNDSKKLLSDTIQLTIQQVLNIKNQYLEEGGKVWILLDNPTSKIINRKELDPTYKANRVRESDSFYRGMDFSFLIFTKYSDDFNCVRIKQLEADDLVKPIVEDLKNEKILLASADMDWARMMADNVHWLSRRGLFTPESFLNEYKFEPNVNTITLWKSIQGDDSDNIPCIEGINEQTTLNIIKNFFDVFDLIDTIKYNKPKVSIMSEYTKKHIFDARDRLILNHQLIYFNPVSDDEIKHATIPGSFNEHALRIMYTSLDFPRKFDKRVKFEEKKFEDVFGFDKIERM